MMYARVYARVSVLVRTHVSVYMRVHRHAKQVRGFKVRTVRASSEDSSIEGGTREETGA